MSDQAEIITFLSQTAEVQEETHISIIFLVGSTAYKLKRAVRFPYVDYSTLESRKKHCEAELALNRRTAPEIYRRVRAITRTADGGLEFDGPGAPADYVLEMRRFSDHALFEDIIQAGQLTPALLRDLTDEIVAFHKIAETAPGGGVVAMRAVIEGNAANLDGGCPPLSRELVERVNDASFAALAAHAALLDRRASAGKIRRCHGDLHLRNIVLWQGRPVLFDAIEFSDAFSCIDILYDLAFLLMDLLHRGERDAAAQVYNRYFDLTREADGLPLLPLFISMRAAIRAHVMLAQGRADEAQAYLTLADEALRPAAPCLLAIGGLSGTGKSTLAAALAGNYPPMPGARVLRSDVLRKTLAGVAPEVRLPESGYNPEMNRRVYAELYAEAEAALTAGYSVILDAAFLRGEDRTAAEALGQRCSAPFTGLWLEAPEALLAARLEARGSDASDAGVEVMRRQRAAVAGEIGWARLDAAAPLVPQIVP
jgi:aminoglycoside phosphotransferase family enzyme